MKILNLSLTNWGAYSRTSMDRFDNLINFFGAICDAGFFSVKRERGLLSKSVPNSWEVLVVTALCIVVNRFRWREIRLMVLSQKAGILLIMMILLVQFALLVNRWKIWMIRLHWTTKYLPTHHGAQFGIPKTYKLFSENFLLLLKDILLKIGKLYKNYAITNLHLN